jgi:hypothetical protein
VAIVVTGARLVFDASALSMQHKGIKAKTCWLIIRIICPNGEIHRPIDSYFNGEIHRPIDSYFIGEIHRPIDSYFRELEP